MAPGIFSISESANKINATKILASDVDSRVVEGRTSMLPVTLK
jgi:hypothetical protein